MKKYLPILIVSVFLLTRPHIVSAQVSLIVSPPRYDETIDPGATIQKTIKITNDTDQEVAIQAKVYDFIVEDESGTPVLVNENASGRYLASPWFTLDRSDFRIAPRTTELVYAVITAPIDALPGGHYAGVFFSPVDVQAPAQTSGAGVIPQIGALFSLTVAGDIKYDALIKDFKTKQNMYEFGPVDFEAVIENQSDTHISPQSSITIKDMIGRELETLQVDQVNIFPFKSRALRATWDQIWGLGRYSATLSVPYGGGQVVARSIYFWIIPWKLIAAIGIVILVLIAILISVRRHIRHRQDGRDSEIDQLKRRIIELENNRH